MAKALHVDLHDVVGPEVVAADAVLVVGREDYLVDQTAFRSFVNAGHPKRPGRNALTSGR